jgi:predicted SAM-dependent methyltransferase
MKLNYGGGRQCIHEYENLDRIQICTPNGEELIKYIVDVEKDKLPFDDNSIDEVLANNVFEHLGDGFIFALNELHRVIKKGQLLIGCVPIAGTNLDFRDITHKRHFVEESFSYICGVNTAIPNRPSHPRYADYEVLPWDMVEINSMDNLINFKITPRK